MEAVQWWDSNPWIIPEFNYLLSSFQIQIFPPIKSTLTCFDAIAAIFILVGHWMLLSSSGSTCYPFLFCIVVLKRWRENLNSKWTKKISEFGFSGPHVLRPTTAPTLLAYMIFQACHKVCRQDASLLHCGCMDPTLPIFENEKICDLNAYGRFYSICWWHRGCSS